MTVLPQTYFAKLEGCPTPERLRRLPRWLQRYERGLRQLASWFHSAQTSRPGPAPAVAAMPPERFNALPVWLQQWINTLRFEVVWWKEKAANATPPEPLRPARAIAARRTNGPVKDHQPLFKED